MKWGRLAVVLVVVLGVVLPGEAARAHGKLVVSSPANGETVAQPVAEVTLSFTEKPAEFAFFSVTAPGGARVDQRWSHAAPFRLAKPVREYQLIDGTWQPLDLHAGFPVRVPVAYWPAKGAYVVRYQTVATDGDEVEGEVRFSYTGEPRPAPPGWQAPADGPSPELAAAAVKPRPSAAPSTQAAAQPAAQPSEQDQNRDRGRGWLVPVLLVVAVAAIVAGLVVRRRKR